MLGAGMRTRMKQKTTIRLSPSAQVNLARIIDSVGCNQTAAIENALAVYAALLSGAQPTPFAADTRYAPDGGGASDNQGAG